MTSSAASAALRNPNVLASGTESDGPIGLVSGKPMRFPFAPIFDTRDPSGANGASNRSTALDDLIQGVARLRAPSFDAGVATPPVPNRRVSLSNGNDSNSPSNGPVAAFTPPVLAPQNPQGPFSLNDAYLEYLKRLNANQRQAPAFEPSASSPPLTPPDDDLRALYGDLAQPWFLQGRR